jgi:feruloyl-CoA synthase
MTGVRAEPRFRAVDAFPPVSLQADEFADGTVLLRCTTPRSRVPATLAAGLAERAASAPDRTLIAARDDDGEWRHVTYAAALDAASRIAAWLRSRQEQERPERILIVTGNSVQHALLTFGAALAGVPICPVSAQYALSSGAARGRLAHVVDLVEPTLVFAESVGPIVPALSAVLPGDVTVLAADPDRWPGAVDWADVLTTAPLPDLDAVLDALDPHAPMRYMLTSGSTGMPKVVVQTDHMWLSLFSGVVPLLAEASGWRERTLDWMPWSHVAGASVLIGSLLNGGSFYLDDGRPTPELFGRTLRNVAEVRPRFFANVPYAFGMLCDALEADPSLREAFFEQLQLCLYGGAGLPQPVYDRFQAMAEATVGERIMFTTGYGCTEATAGVMTITWPTTDVGVGLPVPGVEAKLVPVGDGRYEARLRGACVMPGYLDDPDATARAFDDAGFYRTGDTLRFVDPRRPERGLLFAGRLAEEFKLSTGTFVRGGAVREALVAATSPLVTDAVLCGEGRDEVGALVWLNPAGVAAAIGDGAGEPEILDWIALRLAGVGGAGADRVARVAVLADPPDADAGEVSDKGSINQSIARLRRAADIERLYRPGSAGVRIVG